MIAMPKRSVTRFFIPLIDVLLLLFCIFLLMPLANEEDLKKSQESSQNLTEDLEALERELDALRTQLAQYRESEPKLKELQQLQEELERLKQTAKKSLQERAAFQVIDVDGKTGSIYFYDPAKADMPRLPLDSEAAVSELISRHKKEHPGRDLYYFFLYPRPETGFPTLAQERTYQLWFRTVANSFKEAGP
jgi:biopolymer transport protein ExbD